MVCNLQEDTSLEAREYAVFHAKTFLSHITISDFAPDQAAVLSSWSLSEQFLVISTGGVRNIFFISEVHDFKFCELARNISQTPLPRHELSTRVWTPCLRPH